MKGFSKNTEHDILENQNTLMKPRSIFKIKLQLLIDKLVRTKA
jgi:hypothetical protein